MDVKVLTPHKDEGLSLFIFIYTPSQSIKDPR